MIWDRSFKRKVLILCSSVWSNSREEIAGKHWSNSIPKKLEEICSETSLCLPWIELLFQSKGKKSLLRKKCLLVCWEKHLLIDWRQRENIDDRFDRSVSREKKNKDIFRVSIYKEVNDSSLVQSSAFSLSSMNFLFNEWPVLEQVVMALVFTLLINWNGSSGWLTTRVTMSNGIFGKQIA